MDETILFPSPNWFLVSGLVVTKDGWLIYGGPCKSLCVLEPLPEDHHGVLKGGTSYRTHIHNKANPDKILSVDVSPEWPEKRLVLTGSSDGSAKLWSLEYEEEFNVKCIFSHDIHNQEKEAVVGVGFSTNTYAITVGSFGRIVKWDINTNIVKTYQHFLKSFRPTCVSCSPHTALNVAIGTRQGVVFLLDLEDGKLLYKVRAHNDEIVNMAWCPQYNVTVKKTLDTDDNRNVSSRMDKIRQQAQDELTAESDPDVLEQSGIVKNLPEDSFDNTSVVEEDNLFDMYKDHEADEFGHKKFVPKEVLVKVKTEKSNEVDYLDECLKLKDEILQRKNQPEPSIESLVEALDKTHVDVEAGTSKESEECVNSEASEHIHKHLLASISKHGGIKIWSKSGKLVSHCVLPSVRSKGNKQQRGKNPVCPTVLWYKADVLLIADTKSQLLACNPLVIDGKNKLAWRLIHALHKRGLYYIGTDAPRVQDETTKVRSNYSIWTSAQDRNIIRYSYEKNRTLDILPTCGGFVYMIQPCPYDARRVAASVGDGAIRVWQCDTLDSDDTKLGSTNTVMYWQNVQGKVLSIAWHPTKENLLAFGTAESRVGIVETRGAAGAAAGRTLHPSLRGGVYSLRWGGGDALYAAGAGDLYMYRTDTPDLPPEQIEISVDNIQRQISAVHYVNSLLVFGTMCGGVGVMKDNKVLAAMFVFDKMIHTIEWHPQQTSSSASLSQYKDLMAVCSMDKNHTIAILQYKDNDEGLPTLSLWKNLVGHLSVVAQLAWNPHIEGQLLSTSQDCTVRVWSVSSGACTSIFAGHAAGTLSCSWSWLPQLATTVLSGAGDCTLRMWNTADHPADDYKDGMYLDYVKRGRKRLLKKTEKTALTATEKVEKQESSEEQQAYLETKIKTSKKFLLPIISKQISQKTLLGLRTMLNRCLKSKSIEYDGGNGDADDSQESAIDFVKIFGTNNEVNEVLDMEMARHKENASIEASIMLCILRGQIDAAVSIATENEILDSFILSVAPCVSFKYWKDVTQLYLTQLDRLVAKQENTKLNEARNYGGTVYRKMAALLSIHDIKGAVNALTDAKLFRDAYILCRTRYMDSIAEELLVKWADHCSITGNRYMAAICYLALGNLSQAAMAIGGSNDENLLSLAVEVAKISGQTTLAQHVELKQSLLKNNEVENIEGELDKLPSRIELVMKMNGQCEVNGAENGHSEDGPKINESVVKANGDLETTM